MKQMETAYDSYLLESSSSVHCNELHTKFPTVSKENIALLYIKCDLDFTKTFQLLKQKTRREKQEVQQKQPKKYKNNHKEGKKRTSTSISTPLSKGFKPLKTPINFHDLFKQLIRQKAPDFEKCTNSLTLEFDSFPDVEKIGYFKSIFINNIYFHPNLSQIDYSRLIELFCKIPKFSIAFTHFDSIGIFHLTTHSVFYDHICSIVNHFPLVNGNKNLPKCIFQCKLMHFKSFQIAVLKNSQYSENCKENWRKIAIYCLFTSQKNNPSSSLNDLTEKSRCLYAITQFTKFSITLLFSWRHTLIKTPS